MSHAREMVEEEEDVTRKLTGAEGAVQIMKETRICQRITIHIQRYHAILVYILYYLLAKKNNYCNSTEIIVLGPVLLNISPAG